jgi:hypothetical protein
MTASMFYRKMGLESKLPSMNKKLDKKIFYDSADLKKKEKEVITKYIERMELAYLLTNTTINIQPFINDEYHYEGVMFITVQLREETTDKQVYVIEEIIHGSLPNPTVIVFYLKEDVLISTCMKRLNKVDKVSAVLGDIHHSQWMNLETEDELTGEFIQTIHLSNISFNNFFDFYKEMDIAVEALQNAIIVGSFQIVKDEQLYEQQQKLIREINRMEQEINKLKKAIKKETQFNKKVEFNLKIQHLTKLVAEFKK